MVIHFIHAASSIHCSEYRTAQEVSNPHYVKTSVADHDNNVGVKFNKEESSTLSNAQSQISENEEQSRNAETAKESNNHGDMYKFANCRNSQEKVVDSYHESPGYAAVNMAKHGS